MGGVVGRGLAGGAALSGLAAACCAGKECGAMMRRATQQQIQVRIITLLHRLIMPDEQPGVAAQMTPGHSTIV
jgi:hypothetical protein